MTKCCAPSPGILFMKALLPPVFKTRLRMKAPSFNLTSTSIYCPISALYFIPRVLKSLIYTSWLHLRIHFLFNSSLNLLCQGHWWPPCGQIDPLKSLIPVPSSHAALQSGSWIGDGLREDIQSCLRGLPLPVYPTVILLGPSQGSHLLFRRLLTAY